MKHPVPWHEECLVNMKNNLSDEQMRLKLHAQRVKTLADKVMFAERQIVEAKRRGLEGFDPDRFLVKRTK
jgi:hypothetical protein